MKMQLKFIQFSNMMNCTIVFIHEQHFTSHYSHLIPSQKHFLQAICDVNLKPLKNIVGFSRGNYGFIYLMVH
jgi:hypothetical protein